MPKKQQKDVEIIKQLIRDGLTSVEIHDKTGASEGYIGKLRKETDGSSVSLPSPVVQLSKGSIRSLILMQTSMGVDNVDDAVERIYKDFLLINSKKVRFDPNNEKSIGEVFQQLVEQLDTKMDWKDVIIKVTESDFRRGVMLSALGVNEVTGFFYNLYSGDGNIIDYINDAVKQDYIELGWKVSKYYNEELKENHFMITTPNGKEFRLPLE